MLKTLVQLFIIVGMFVGVWYLASRVKWTELFRIEQLSEKTEQKLGDIFWEFFKKTGEEDLDSTKAVFLDSLLIRIGGSNAMEVDQFKVHLLKNKEINAFALPDGHLVFHTGLIEAAESPEEVAGVMAHEMAHIELRHVRKKLIKEVGISLLINMAMGGGSETIMEVARMLSSTAFDRRMEKEADLKAVEYLMKANIDPNRFADFMSRALRSEQFTTWISTHPDSEKRAEYIRENASPVDTIPIVSVELWEAVK